MFRRCLCFVAVISVFLFLNQSSVAQNSWAKVEPATVENFQKKDLQIIVIKNPGNNQLKAKTGWEVFKTPKAINDQLVVVKAKGKIIRTFITSTGDSKIGKETPDGIYLGVERCAINKTSTIYKSEMDWAMMFCGPIGIHATTESHYCKLGQENSMGCVRLLRSNARDLFRFAHGDLELEGIKENFVLNKKIGVRVISGNSVINYWNTLSEDEKSTVLKQSLENRKEIDAEINKFKTSGDVKDDEFEDTMDEYKAPAPSHLEPVPAH